MIGNRNSVYFLVFACGRRQGLVEWEGQNQPEIELNASAKFHKICSMEKSVQS
jgi:hypothetical protein